MCKQCGKPPDNYWTEEERRRIRQSRTPLATAMFIALGKRAEARRRFEEEQKAKKKGGAS